MIRKHIQVRGRVQGVGFRYTVMGIALHTGKPGGNRWIRIDQMDVSEIPLVNVAKERGFIPKSY